MSDEVAPHARYDEVAEWYEGWIGEEPGVLCAEGLVPEDLAGQRILDVACGPGRLARELSRRGAHVAGVDVSGGLLARARKAGNPGPGTINYTAADIAQPESWSDGRLFDAAVCEMALQDIEDLTGAVTAVSAALRPGAWWAVSLVHPCFPGSATGLPSWPPQAGYDAEGWWRSNAHNPDGARIRVGSYHRRLSTYLNAFLGAGLVLETVSEPPRGLPMLLAMVWRKATVDRG